MKILVKFYADFGRMGELDGMFIEDSKVVQGWIGQEVYFGEVLGKHSDVDLVLEAEHFKTASDDQEFIEKLEAILGTHIAGHVPDNYTMSGDDE